MSFYALAVLCATALTLVTAEDLEFPAQTCKHDADDYSSCLRLAMQEAWPNIVTGLPKFDIPVLDPYFTEKESTTYETSDIHADITVMNVNTYGLSKAKFLAVRPSYSDDYFKMEVDIDLPKVLIEGNYEAHGSMGSFQIGGEGFFNISMEDIKSTWTMEGSVANDRLTVEHFTLNPEVGKMQIWFSDLFNGNEGLNQAALAFVNQYWPTLYRSMLPFVAKSWDEHLTELSNRVFMKVSFSKLFP
ncbi:PREDICTED: circadian clock-controlled protein-like [Dinoponera quadriceps]|uniref:Circadian clock-controlled protein-like n=1 Tax=Dinoponera quadriceps TaxID=609295 RepID=A0A6P3WWY9_DINQU|nr:PREDICTED: circadian clock-controlled protein-like [Dinoponera quadriceps]